MSRAGGSRVGGGSRLGDGHSWWPTANGVALALVGTALLAAGLWIGARDLVGLAVVVISPVALAAVGPKWRHRAGAAVTRVVRAQPVCGQPFAVATTIAGPLSPAGTVADALSGCVADAAPTFSNDDDGALLRLDYTVVAATAGVHQLGPVVAECGDAYGVANVRRRIGPVTAITVWPQTFPLVVEGLAGARPAAAGHGGTGACDDTTLREYLPGDDLRRIHWPTSARRGAPMVRVAERSPARQVQLYLDPALLGGAAEGWALEHLGSLACSLLAAGNEVRILGVGDAAFTSCQQTGAAALLNQVAMLPSAQQLPGATHGRRARGLSFRLRMRGSYRGEQPQTAQLKRHAREAQQALAMLGAPGVTTIAVVGEAADLPIAGGTARRLALVVARPDAGSGAALEPATGPAAVRGAAPIGGAARPAGHGAMLRARGWRVATVAAGSDHQLGAAALARVA